MDWASWDVLEDTAELAVMDSLESLTESVLVGLMALPGLVSFEGSLLSGFPGFCSPGFCIPGFLLAGFFPKGLVRLGLICVFILMSSLVVFFEQPKDIASQT